MLTYMMRLLPRIIRWFVAVPSYQVFSSFLIVFIADDTSLDVLVSSIVAFQWYVIMSFDFRSLQCFFGCPG